MSKKKKRNVFIAGLFNLIIPGLGFLYLGKLAYAIGLPFLLVLLLGLTSWSKFIFNPTGFAIMLVIGLSVQVAGIALACFMAHRAGKVELTKLQKWYVYLGFIVLFLFVNNILIENRAKLFGYDTFRFPAGSMMETLIPGDVIISDAWKYKTIPPSRRDVVVFLYPKNPSIRYVKRIIGLPGDYIEIANGIVVVNGKEIKEDYIEERNNLRLSYKMPGTYRVPDNAYFILGDNRDNSNDSRFWGFVPSDHIQGSVEFILFSYDSLSGVRGERLGKRVK